MDLLNEGDSTTTDGITPSRPPATLSAEELMGAVEDPDTCFHLPSRWQGRPQGIDEYEMEMDPASEPEEPDEIEAADEWSTEVTAAQNDVAWFEAMTPDHRSAWAREMLRRGRRLRISLDRETRRWLKGLILRKDT